MNRGLGVWCLRLGVLAYQATLRPFMGGTVDSTPPVLNMHLRLWTSMVRGEGGG